jgi:ribosome maturation factor RimP
MRVVPEIEEELDARVAELGYELVDVRWGGSGQRPLLKLRIDRPDSKPGRGVTVDECATVSRALEPWLDAHEALSRRYVLEVSSPGVDRPLVRPRDYERFRGERVGLQEEGAEEEAVVLRLSGGEEVSVPRSKVRRVNLVFEWK